jgi:hypothetical protein
METCIVNLKMGEEREEEEEDSENALVLTASNNIPSNGLARMWVEVLGLAWVVGLDWGLEQEWG